MSFIKGFKLAVTVEVGDVMIGGNDQTNRTSKHYFKSKTSYHG